jgi:hypothetical protein
MAWSCELPREHAHYSDHGHNVSLAWPREQACSMACYPNLGVVTKREREKKR